MNNPWFTADTHFGHEKIIGYCDRPFKNVEEMDSTMILNWNEVVDEHDEVYHLGDFAFTNDPEKVNWYLSQLNGKVRLVKGNHDNLRVLKKTKFAFIKPVMDLRVNNGRVDVSVTLSHFAHRVWNKKHYGAWHLHGHSHGRLERVPGDLSLDVGQDCWGFTPVSFDKIHGEMEKIKVEHEKTRA